MRTKTRKSLVLGTPQRLPGGSKHTTAEKLTAVRDVKQLMSEGITKWAALEQIARDLDPRMSATAVNNWVNKYANVTGDMQRSNGNITDTLHTTRVDGFIVQSINVRLTNGTHADLAPVDINKIASLASTIC